MHSTATTTIRKTRSSSFRDTMKIPAFSESAAAAASFDEDPMDMHPLNSVNAQTSSEDDVQISLDIQKGFGQAWSAALSRVGAISLAWHNDTDLTAQSKSAREIDPSLVFDGVQAVSASQTSKESTQSTTSLNGVNQPVNSDQCSYLPKQTNANSVLSTAGRTRNSHKRTARHHRPINQTTKSKASSIMQSPKTISPMSSYVPVVSTRASNDAIGTKSSTGKPHRMSIRLERLLPHPKTPDSASIAKSILISPRLNRNRRILHSQRWYESREAANEVSRTLAQRVGLRRRTNSLPNLTKCDIENISLHTTSKRSTPTSGDPGMQQGDGYLSSLEDQVSDMFTGLGLRSPYTDTSGLATADQWSNTKGDNVNRDSVSLCRPDQIPWFYQPRYTTGAAELAGPGQERPSIVLVDDDSSCAENTADSTFFSHRGYLSTKGSMGGSPIILTESSGRRQSTLNTPRVHSNVQTANVDMFYRDRLYSSQSTPRGTTKCAACRGEYKPCCQMHTVLGRIEQADQFIQSVGHHASAVDSLLADLRTKSRALSETLLISQSRASSLSHTLAGTIDAALSLKSSNDSQVQVLSMSMTDVGSDIRLDQYRRFSKKIHSLQKRASSLGVREQGDALTREGGPDITNATKKTHVRSWLDTVALASTNVIDSASESEFDPEKTPRENGLAANNSTSVASGSVHTALVTNSVNSFKQAKGCNYRHRRPVQPISVRIQRISKQWDQLQASIEDLGISNFQNREQQQQLGGGSSSKDSSTADGLELLNLHMASELTADSLKLIQRILKTAHEALNAAKSVPSIV